MVIIAEIYVIFLGIVPRPDGALLLSLNVTDTVQAISHRMYEHVDQQQVAFSSLARYTHYDNVDGTASALFCRSRIARVRPDKC